MGWSVAETFERVRPHLPAWFEPEALERCARIAARIPNATSSHYIEFRVGGSPQLDVLTCSRDKRIAAQFAALLGPEPSASWSANLAILREWAAETGELGQAPFMYFEYDADARFNAREPEASLSVGLEDEYTARHWRGLLAPSAKSLSLGRVAYGRLIPAVSKREAVLSELQRCYAALPPRGAIPHAPVMTTREPVAAKPYVVLPRADIFEFLTKIGWPGSASALAELLATYYAPFRESVYLDLTVSDRVEERIGVATSQFQRLEADFSSLDWWKLPRALAHYKDALRRWVGHSEERLGGQRVWIHRWLDTKAVLSHDKVEYKGYLGFGPTLPPLFC